MNMERLLGVGAVSLALISPLAAAQNEQQPEPAAEVKTHEPFVPSWSDEGIAKVAGMLSGAWETTQPVAEFGSEAQGSTNIIMEVGPVPVEGVPNALYAETARSDDLGSPYRQAIFSLYRYKDSIRLRTYEFRMPGNAQGVLVGTWAAPDYFPNVSRNELIATLDVELKPSGGGFAGSTPYPYPTGKDGAVEMTSHVELSASKLITADRGYDANGNVVWGAGESAQWSWKKIENPVKVMHMDKGVIALEYARPEGDAIEAKDSIHIHYSGWTADGNLFDSSRARERPFIFQWPAPGRLIDGWNIGVEGMTVGTKRRLIIPSEVGYGERGQPRANIPPNATLYFEIELMHFDRPEPEPAQPEGEQPVQPDDN